MEPDQEITISDFVRIPFALFSTVGLRLFFWHPTDTLTTREHFALVGLMIVITFDLISMINFLIDGELESALDLTALFVYWGFALNSLCKGFTVWIGRANLEVVCKQIKARFPTTPSSRRKYLLSAYYEKIRRYNKYLTIYHLATTTMFNLFPLLQSTMAFYDNGEFSYTLPFHMLYLFDVKQPPTYALAYFMQCLGAYSLSCFFLGSDLLLITVVHLINMNFEYLVNTISDFQPVGSDADIRKLGVLLSYHEEVLNCSVRVDQVFSISILLNYCGSCLVICLIGFQIVAGTEFLHLLKFLAFLISTLVHVYFISHFGTNMITLSLEVSDAFARHAWYDGKVNYMRMLPLPTARAQRPAHLTAFKFFEISMESFKTLMTTSYQFFTLISSSLDEEE